MRKEIKKSISGKILGAALTVKLYSLRLPGQPQLMFSSSRLECELQCSVFMLTEKTSYWDAKTFLQAKVSIDISE